MKIYKQNACKKKVFSAKHVSHMFTYRKNTMLRKISSCLIKINKFQPSNTRIAKFNSTRSETLAESNVKEIAKNSYHLWPLLPD